MGILKKIPGWIYHPGINFLYTYYLPGIYYALDLLGHLIFNSHNYFLLNYFPYDIGLSRNSTVICILGSINILYTSPG